MTREAITKAQLEDFETHLPSISEEEKIVADIAKIEERAESLKKEVLELMKRKEEIIQKHL